MVTSTHPILQVHQLDLAYDDHVVMRDLNFSVNRGEVFVIMGGSGCGKSTLLKVLIGLKKPAQGQVVYDNKDFWAVDHARQQMLLKRFGVLYQSGALWSSLTVGENVALPLQLYSALTPAQIKDMVHLKLSLVGLGGYEDLYPSELSGGMRKRAGLARAIALDPDIVFFDEPSAGLDPVSARMLDDLILQLRDYVGATIVVVTHELASIFAIADNAIFLDAQKKTLTAAGNPKDLLARSHDPNVIQFLTRGEKQGVKG